MSKPVQVEVVLSHVEHLPVVDVWMIVDILRATTVMVSWFEAGGTELYPAVSLESARSLAEALKAEGHNPLLMGEQNAIAPQGFDLGNSPLDITPELIQKRPCAVMATTNGTKAMLKAASTGTPVLVACARNAFSALDKALSIGRRIGIFCSGRKGRPAWDDTLCAGLLIARLTEHFPEVRLADSARLAHLAWLASKDFATSLKTADHAIFLSKIGYGSDIDFAAEIDVAQLVPELFEFPNGDGMRVVLRAEGKNPKPLILDERPLPAAPGVSGAALEVLPRATKEAGEWSSEPISPQEDRSGVGHIFFPGESFKKQHKGKSKKA